MSPGHSAGLPRHLAVFGFPVAHSVSPAMHNAAFRQEGMNCVYSAFQVDPANVQAAVDAIRALGLHGVNITIPHKESVIPYLDEVDPAARQIGAVNTIANRDGKLIGYNTDGRGFISTLEETGVKLRGLNVVILGAGGAARGIGVYLAMAGVRQIAVSNRTVRRAETLADVLAQAAPDVPTGAVEAYTPDEDRVLATADLVVNCTPVGMEPDVATSRVRNIGVLPAHAVVCDTVYRPLKSLLVREADRRGLTTVGGLRMLIHQGACAWEHWFGRMGPVDIMYNTALAALGESRA